MTVADIERIGSPAISRSDARRAFLEYRAAVLMEKDATRKAEYEGLMRGYRAIARGQQVIDLHQTLHTAGVQETTLYPRLAICRADAKRCRVVMESGGAATFADEAFRWQKRASRRRVHLPVRTFPPYQMQWEVGRRVSPSGALERERWANQAVALVPIVPPHLHPQAALGNYHILWDAVWEPAPPKDPVLLRHLSGMLYAVVAHWDLTPLEQAVLLGRL